MHPLRFAFVLGALSVGLGAGPVRAQEAGPAPGRESLEEALARAAADLGRHFLLATEAKLREGRALLEAGRVEEGLAALRAIPVLLEKHEELVRRVLRTAGGRAPEAPKPPAPAPAAAAPQAPPPPPSPPSPPPIVWEPDDAPAPVPVPALAWRLEPRQDLVLRGGSKATEAAVAAALRWLKDHQDPDGSWSCDNFQKNCRKNICEGKGSAAEHTTGTTALALLAFLGAGHSPRTGIHRDVVRKGVAYLVSVQGPDGRIGPKIGDGAWMYGHAMGAMALAEAYGLAGQAPQLKVPAQKAAEFLMVAQNPYLGWRYGVRPGDNDTSVTGWATFALWSAKACGLDVPPEGFQGVKNWLDKVTDDSFYKTGYTQKGDNGNRLPEAQKFMPSEAMTAIAVACRAFMGGQKTMTGDSKQKGGATLLRNMPPRWDPEATNDFYYWYFGTLAMFQMGGDYWRVWNSALKDALVKTQRRGGDENGSWDPCDAWGVAGGRVYSTAMNAVSLEVYYRYARPPQTPRPVAPPVPAGEGEGGGEGGK